MTQTLAAFHKGHRFPPTRLTLDEGLVRSYVEAVEDDAIKAHLGLVPPMALAALSVRSLLDTAGLPAGAIHAAQELAFKREAHVGDSLTALASVASRGERAGWVLMGIDLAVHDTKSELVMTGRATITFPVEGS
jgi:acyl dehydratase